MGERLAGKTAVITGGTRGIGLSIAQSMAREGAKVVVASRKPEAVEAAAAAINAQVPGSTVGRTLHIGKLDQVVDFAEWVHTEVGLVDVLVNNAATNPYLGPALGLEWGAWDKTFEVNLKGPFELTRQVSQRLLEAEKGGSIINVSSIFGLVAAPMQGIYGMTKAAMVSMTRTLAHELGRGGIRVNAVAPGLVETKLSEALVKSPMVKRYTDRAALGRYGQPEDIAGLVVFLASDESRFITGQVHVADGGYLHAA